MKIYTFFEESGRKVSVGWSVNTTQFSAPLDPDNTDYQQFLKDWEAGATVLSSTGVPLPWGSEPS